MRMEANRWGANDPIVLPFGDVYLLYYDRVYRYCFGLMHGSHVAEDIASDVFVSAFLSYDRVKPDAGGVLFWLLRIAKNHAISHVRREQRLRRALARLGTASEPPRDVESEVAVYDELRRLATAVSVVHASDRRIIGLRVGEDMSYRQISAALGMTHAAAAWATQRALRRVHAVYQLLEDSNHADVSARAKARQLRDTQLRDRSVIVRSTQPSPNDSRGNHVDGQP
jgi:RNA polymerase sigma factor (sigma-70 family)